MTRAVVREDQIHGSIVSFLRTAMPDALVFHPANGGARDKREAAKLKWLGVLAGIPDIVIVRPEGRTGFMEVKAPDGRVAASQAVIRDHCVTHGIPWALVRSIDDAQAALERWGFDSRTTVNPDAVADLCVAALDLASKELRR